jgi:hypothetical protein
MRRRPLHQPIQHTPTRAMAAHLSGALPAAAMIANPLHTWRGFFVSSLYWFGFYFYGYRQTPARDAARQMLD